MAFVAAIGAGLTLSVAMMAAGCEGTQSRPRAADCKQLVGTSGLVGQALAFAHPEGVVTAEPSGNTDRVRTDVQERLFTISTRSDRALADPLGQLVDFLDDPPTYRESPELSAKVQSAADAIEKFCAT